MLLNVVVTALVGFVDKLGRTVTGFFFPERCVDCGQRGKWLCPRCAAGLSYADHQRCPVCRRPAIGGFTHPHCETRYNPDRFLSPFEYRDPLRTAVRRAKYWGSWALFAELASLLSSWLEYSDIRFLPGTALVPMPLHFLRLWGRGYNQSLFLAKFLGERLGLPVEESLLVRTRYTRSQTELSAEERRENVRGSFSCPRGARGENLVLVDDISTTGATLLEAARVLKRKGARTVWCLTLACGR